MKFRYFYDLLISMDLFANSATGGKPRETLSSRAGRAMLRGERWGCVFCKVMDLFEKNHCIKNINVPPNIL